MTWMKCYSTLIADLSKLKADVDHLYHRHYPDEPRLLYAWLMLRRADHHLMNICFGEQPSDDACHVMDCECPCHVHEARGNLNAV